LLGLLDVEVSDARLQLLGLGCQLLDICSDALAFCCVTLSSC